MESPLSIFRMDWDDEPASFVAAGLRPAVEPGILPGGMVGCLRFSVRRDAALDGRRDACRYGPGSSVNEESRGW